VAPLSLGARSASPAETQRANPLGWGAPTGRSRSHHRVPDPVGALVAHLPATIGGHQMKRRLRLRAAYGVCGGVGECPFPSWLVRHRGHAIAYTPSMPRRPTLASTTIVRAAVYCRISLARHGETIKVDDQEKLCRAVARQRGWTVAAVFKDNSRSAWQRNRKRDGWDAMLAAIEQGHIDAIIVYHGDRLIRQPWDLELLIRLADERGIRLASPTGERDLDNADDRFILRIEAAQACRESDNTSRRLKRHYDRMAENGIVRLGGRGGRAFGFEPDGLTIRTADAGMLREAADRILAGEHLGAICRDLNDRGFRTTTGNPWGHGALKKLMLRPRLAGLLSHRGEILGNAAWPAILDRDRWETVVAVLEHKATGFTYTTNTRRYLLTGIAVCGTCGHPVTIRHNTRAEALRGYGCIHPGCPKKVHRSVRHVDPYVEGHVLAHLNDDTFHRRLRPAGAGQAAADLARLEAHRRRILEEFGDAGDDPDAVDVVRVSLARNRANIDRVRAEIAAGQRTHILDGAWGIDLARWRRLDLSRQRAIVNATVRVTILPSTRRGPGFDPGSVTVARRESGPPAVD
jgi:site-specific DNA recombinase